MRVVKAIQTSGACPSQWDAWLDDGTYVYLRYRYGWGTVGIDADRDNNLIHFQHGDDLDGHIELDEFCTLAGIELAL